MSNAIFIVTGYFKISLRFWLENQKNNILTSNISSLDCRTLPPPESNYVEEIIANIYRHLKDIIALHETNTITKHNLAKERKGFSKNGEETTFLY